VAVRAGAFWSAVRGAARVDSSQFRLAPFDRPILKIFKHNFKNLEYQSCRATKGEHFS
jgi:hypothetical protein